VQEQHHAVVAGRAMDQHVRRSGVDDLVVAGADLLAFAPGVQDALEPYEQAVRVAALGGHVDALVAQRPLADDRCLQPFGVRTREAGVAGVVPLHGGADRLAFGQIEVLAHADLVPYRMAGVPGMVNCRLEAISIRRRLQLSMGASRHRIPRW